MGNIIFSQSTELLKIQEEKKLFKTVNTVDTVNIVESKESVEFNQKKLINQYESINQNEFQEQSSLNSMSMSNMEQNKISNLQKNLDQLDIINYNSNQINPIDHLESMNLQSERNNHSYIINNESSDFTTNQAPNSSISASILDSLQTNILISNNPLHENDNDLNKIQESNINNYNKLDLNSNLNLNKDILSNSNRKKNKKRISNVDEFSIEEEWNDQTQAMEFIYSQTIPYSIIVPSHFRVLTEGPRVYFIPKSPTNPNIKNRSKKIKLFSKNKNLFKNSQVVIQVSIDSSVDCLQFAMKQWPTAHWETVQILKQQTRIDKDINIQKLITLGSKLKYKEDDGKRNDNFLPCCRTMQTVRGKKISLNKFQTEEIRYYWSLDQSKHSNNQINEGKNVWLNLTVYVIDGGDGLFYWITGISESQAPKVIRTKKRFLFKTRLPHLKNYISVYTSSQPDPVCDTIFCQSYEFPRWRECSWTKFEMFPFIELIVKIPPLWKKLEGAYIVSPIQVLSDNSIQEHFLISKLNSENKEKTLQIWIQDVIKSNTSHDNVELLLTNQVLELIDFNAFYNVFVAAFPSKIMMKIVVNLEDKVSKNQYLVTYVSSCGFRSIDIWNRFIKEISIASNANLNSNPNSNSNSNSNLKQEKMNSNLEWNQKELQSDFYQIESSTNYKKEIYEVEFPQDILKDAYLKAQEKFESMNKLSEEKSKISH